MNTAITTPNQEPVAPHRTSLGLRLALVALGAACIAGFHYGNSRAEEFRLNFPSFQPWLWNLYLTCFLAGLVGVIAMWWSRRWGFWTLVWAGVLASAIGGYAMGFTMIGAAIIVVLVAAWLAVQPDWEKMR
jgi:hypothetical protein